MSNNPDTEMYDLQATHDSSMDSDRSNGQTQIMPAQARFWSFRNRTEKWGRILEAAGYCILIVNCLGLVMTTLGILGFYEK